MTDRKTRDQMAEAIRSYMNEEITAFEFDAKLTEASEGTDDRTAQTIARALWCHYDDLKDHKIVASKEEWDYFNRLLLLLESDAEMEIKSRRKWHPVQAVAALLLLAFCLIAWRVGWSGNLFVYAVPFGPPSMVPAWLNSRRRRNERHAPDIALTPFPSVVSLLAVRRRLRGFARRRYPKAIRERRIRAPIIDNLIWVRSSIVWCLLSPVALLFQTLPDSDVEVHIRLPTLSAGVYALPRTAQP